jgi:hypothetical protein
MWGNSEEIQHRHCTRPRNLSRRLRLTTTAPYRLVFKFLRFCMRADTLYSLRIRDQKLERLVSLKNVQRVFRPVGPWSGLTPDNSALVLRDIGTQDVHAFDVDFP